MTRQETKVFVLLVALVFTLSYCTVELRRTTQINIKKNIKFKPDTLRQKILINE